MLRNWKFWVVVAVLGALLGVGAGWVTMRVWANYHAGRLLSGDIQTQLDAMEAFPAELLIKRRGLCRGVLRRLPGATDSAVIDFYNHYLPDTVYESESLRAGIPLFIEAVLRTAERRDPQYNILAPIQAVTRLRSEHLSPPLMDLWTVAAEHPDERIRRAAISYATGLPDDFAAMAIGLFLEDPSESVARRGWLLMAFLDPISGHSGNWRAARDGVAEAILYAAMATSDRPEIVLGQVDADPALRERFTWVKPFLDRIERLAAGSLRRETESLGDDLMARLCMEIAWVPAEEEHLKPQLRLTRVHGLIRDFAAGEAGSEQMIRYLFVDHPLAEIGTMSERQHAFASELLDAWWRVNDRYYEFDESEMLFRRKTNKAPE